MTHPSYPHRVDLAEVRALYTETDDSIDWRTPPDRSNVWIYAASFIPDLVRELELLRPVAEAAARSARAAEEFDDAEAALTDSVHALWTEL